MRGRSARTGSSPARRDPSSRSRRCDSRAASRLESARAEDDVLASSSTARGALVGERARPPRGYRRARPAGENAKLSAGEDGLTRCALDRFASRPACTARAARAARRDRAVEAGSATGKRSFQVLYGPHNGSTRATLFVGYVPPGRRRGISTSTTRSSGSGAARVASTRRRVPNRSFRLGLPNRSA